jgi:hypothetical protein
MIQSGQQYSGCLKADKFWAYAGKKNNKVWLIFLFD